MDEPKTRAIDITKTITIDVSPTGLTFVDGAMAATPADARRLIAAALPGLYTPRKRKSPKVAAKK